MRATLSALLLLCTASAALAGAGAAPRTTVIELYTSEGCSSCPPAEAQLEALARQDGVVALAFHVDYWDDLGWHDRFGLKEAVTRQRLYAQRLHLASVYTPQLVIDGQRDQVGGGGLGAAVPVGSPAPAVVPQIATGADRIEVSLAAGPSPGACDVLLIGYLPEATSKVTRGENAGRELHEFNIVRSLSILGRWQGEARRFTVPLTALPSDATAVAVLVQRQDQGPILGAASRALR